MLAALQVTHPPLSRRPQRAPMLLWNTLAQLWAQRYPNDVEFTIWRTSRSSARSSMSSWITPIWCLTKATSIQRGEECSVLLYTCTHWQGTHEEAPEHASETTVEILENCWTYYVLNSSMNLMGLGNKNVHAICKEPCKQNQHKGQKHQQHSCNNCIKQYPSGCSLWWAKDSNCNSFSLNYGKHVFHFAILKSSLMSFNNRSRTFCIVLLQTFYHTTVNLDTENPNAKHPKTPLSSGLQKHSKWSKPPKTHWVNEVGTTKTDEMTPS